MSLGNDMQFTILGQIETLNQVCLPRFLYLCLEACDLVVREVQDKVLVWVKELHLVQEVFLDKFTILLDGIEVRGCDRLQFD